MSHTITLDASEHPVSSVTVYQHRAEVVRNFSVELEAGQSEVQISKLPTCMDESSLRVDGVGNAVIFDVITSRLSPELTIPKESSEKVAALEAQQAEIRRQLVVHATQSSVLNDFSKTLTAKDVNPAQLVEFMGILQQRGAALGKEGDELEKKMEQVSAELARERKGQVPSEEARKLAMNVTVVVLAEKAGHAELTVKYVVSQANWEPLYDLRATVDANPKAQSSTSISLNYRASITQTTGEPWSDVELILSTSSPLTGTDIPQLQPQRIGPVPVPQIYRGSFKKRAKRMAVPAASMALPRGGAYGMGGGGMDEESEGGTELYMDMSAAPPPLMEMRRTEAREGAISTSFFIEGRSNVPSDGAVHKVAIGVLDLGAKLEWITVPRMNTSAFLQCQITNSSSYALLPGSSNIFLDGSFVSKSTIPYVSPQDTFPCSVGVDPSVRITYPPQSKKARTQGSGSFLGSSKQDVTLFTQRVTLKNTRTSEVKLLVRDLVPVSEEQRFKVSVLEPKGLAEAKMGEEVKLSSAEGVAFCYWARKDWDQGDKGTVSVGSVSKVPHKSSQSDVPDGQVEWVVTLGAGKSRELVLSWEVAAPLGEKWETH